MVLKFGLDPLGAFFLVLYTFMWIVTGIFALGFMAKQANKKRFYVCYILTYVMLACLCFAQNWFTMFSFYAFMTILSSPLVLHDGTDEAIAAGRKYLFYTFAGATLTIFGMVAAGPFSTTLAFTAGGALKPEAVSSGSQLFKIAVFLTVLGFGANTGLYPLHSGQVLSHSEAPAPAAALLSGVSNTAGVLCIIRVIWYVFGPEIIRGSWVQYALSALAVLTCVLGAIMAYQQKYLKKRLAYTSISQLSYVLFGIFCLNPIAMVGALLHVVYHAVIKSCLFMAAGGIMQVNEPHGDEPATEIQIARSKGEITSLAGIFKEMPVTMSSFTLASFGLVGIPPFAGFSSKWYLGTGSLAGGLPVLRWLGPALLLLSALVTAACMIPICIKTNFMIKDKEVTCHELSPQMIFPIILLALLVVLLGIFAQPLIDVINGVIAAFM